MNIEELEFVEGGVFADAIPTLRACAGLSLPSDVPVGALREVVEALRAMLPDWAEEAMDESLTAYKPFCELTAPDVRRALKALSQLSETTSVVEDKGPEIELPFSVIMDKCRNWDAFCNDVGLNPWCMNEGLASGSDTYSAPLSTFQKHGII